MKVNDETNIVISYTTRSAVALGRVLDLRLKDRGFQTHRRHCVVSLSKPLYPQLITGSIEENRKLSPHD